jgi:hypothetical protein
LPYSRAVRIPCQIALAALLAGLLWFNFGQQRPAGEVIQGARDLFDKRPPRRILLLGNSRIFQNNMPAMLRPMADSAGSPTKWQITGQLIGGSSFESLWGEPYTQQLLVQSWDDAVAQENSGAQLSQEGNASFLTYGEKLLGAIRLRSGHPRLVVGWAYDPPYYANGRYGFSREDHLRWIAQAHTELAQRTGAHLVHLGHLWEEMRAAHPEIAMTSDDNHPTLAASYLYALLLYADLSDSDASQVTWAPPELPAEQAQAMREAVRRFVAWGESG